MALKENYKDDILDTSQNVKRKYQMENNGDGTVSFTDVTEYTQQGDSFGSGAINPIAHAINGLNNYNFHPSGSIELVALIADDSYYLNNDNKYVLADSPTGQALITSEPSTYKALASNTDLYGIEGEDTVSGFEPSCTPITVGGETLSTIDDKLNYIIEGLPNATEIYTVMEGPGTKAVLNLKTTEGRMVSYSTLLSGENLSISASSTRNYTITALKKTTFLLYNPANGGTVGALTVEKITLEANETYDFAITTSSAKNIVVVNET